VLVVIAIGIGALFYPYVRDDYVLDSIVEEVALDWKDFGEETAKARLQYELDHRQIGLQVPDEACAMSADENGTQTVECAWAVVVTIPVVQLDVPMSFQSQATVLESTPDN